jgi:acetyltransferase (isoleucine patch superfamily)-like protein
MNTKKLYIAKILCFLLPETALFSLKNRLYRWCGIKIGENVRICSSVIFLGTGEIMIGNDVWIGPRSIIISGSEIKIGNYVDIGPDVYVGTGSHEIDPIGDHSAGKGKNEPIYIEDGCWIGTRATILPGIKISKKTVIAAAALVNKTIAPYSIAAGVPARVIRKL